jgi:hypothetical protein
MIWVGIGIGIGVAVLAAFVALIVISLKWGGLY